MAKVTQLVLGDSTIKPTPRKIRKGKKNKKTPGQISQPDILDHCTHCLHSPCLFLLYSSPTSLLFLGSLYFSLSSFTAIISGMK
jgi:hypothetical protein